MEVKLDKRYPVAASPEQAWRVLSDIRATAACMPGAQITEQLDATHFKGTVRSKVGPAVMMFGGDIELLGIDPAARELKMLGKGADKSGSSASMNLVAHLEAGETTSSSVLVGQATILVSGKLAQFGSRLLVPVSDAMLGQFANNFNNAAVAAAAVPELAPAPAPARSPGPAPALPLTDGTASAASTATPTGAPPASAAADAASASQRPDLRTDPRHEGVPTPAAAAGAPLRPQATAPAAPANELNALGLMWIVIKGWFAGLFTKKK